MENIKNKIEPYNFDDENPVVATFLNAEGEVIGEMRRNDTCEYEGGSFCVGLLYEYD
jgi:hypothetical protein